MAIFLLFLASCASAQLTKADTEGADYGEPITQAVAETKVRQFMQGYLKDPYSAIYQWKPLYKGSVKSGAVLRGYKVYHGYILEGTVNAKNSYGGYVGAKPYQFVFYNGEIMKIFEQQISDGTAYMAEIL